MENAMQTTSSIINNMDAGRPWYSHRWPWFLMLGPLLVILAGIPTMWLAFTRQDALVVGDYYKQGQAINQDLRRDRAAQALGMETKLQYDAANGKLIGTLYSHGHAQSGKLLIKLIHSTQPEKDLSFEAQSDRQGNFSVTLPMLEIARWQVMIESGQRDWRLNGIWSWPQQRMIDIKAEQELDM
jgi:uncharacterized protein